MSKTAGRISGQAGGILQGLHRVRFPVRTPRSPTAARVPGGRSTTSPTSRTDRGEKIVALDRSAGEVLGWVGLFPDRDARGAFFHLAGIEVHADHRGRGIGTGLMAAARDYVSGHRCSRLRFGTSPLLVPCAALYVTRLGTRYHWKEGVRLADGRPWPCVSCECDFEDPLPESRDIARRTPTPAAW